MNYRSVSIPRKRSAFRKLLGKRIYIFKRHLQWILASGKFAKKDKGELLAHQVVQHSSILLRELKNLDMQLQHNKIENLKIALRNMNQVLIKPGETFSFWNLTGNPSKSRGFKKGMVLENGQVRSGYGGGLCQLANLIYWMAIHSPLTVTERWRHSFDVFPDVNRTIPFGCGATVSYNYIDLQIKNNTQEDFQFHLWLTEKDLCGEIRSAKGSPYRYEIVERNHRIQQEISGHYSRHNQIFRNVFDKKTGALLQEELLTENHALMMYSPLIQQNNSIPKA